MPRELTKDFFWDRVHRPKKVGSVRARNKEEVTLSVGDKLLQERICGTESSRKDFDDFESVCDDDSIASIASTCGGSRVTAKKNIHPEEDECPGMEEDWENLEEEVRPDMI